MSSNVDRLDGTIVPPLLTGVGSARAGEFAGETRHAIFSALLKFFFPPPPPPAPVPAAAAAPTPAGSAPPNSAPTWSDFLLADTGMGEAFDAQQLAANNVLGVFHQVVLGDTIGGAALTQRLADGKAAGLLQMLSMIPSEDQAAALQSFQTAVQAFGPTYKYAVDWEPASDEEDALDFAGLFALLQAIKNQTNDARPLLYLNNDYLVNRLTDAEITQLRGIGTELWYARYASEATANGAIANCPLFVRYWQCSCPDDPGEQGDPPLPSIPGNSGADYSRFNGTQAQFQACFPFKV